MSDFKIGDEIFHKSNSTIKWIVESVNENEVYCSTVMKETFEQKKEVFAITSIKKCSEPKIIVGRQTRNNHW
jgi:hypothetical protein